MSDEKKAYQAPETETPETKTTRRVCPVCGAKVSDLALRQPQYSFCPNCGNNYPDWIEYDSKNKYLILNSTKDDKTVNHDKTSNPAIEWMMIGCFLVLVGLIVIILASVWTPDIYHPDMTEEESLKAYANELEEKATYVFYGGVIEIIGFLIFMPATIWGVSWNAERANILQRKLKKVKEGEPKEEYLEL